MNKPSSADGSVDAVTKPVDAVTVSVVADFERRSFLTFSKSFGIFDIQIVKAAP